MAPIGPEELERIKAAGRRMYQGGLAAGTLGAIAVRLDSGAIAVTASGARLGFLEGDDLVVLDSIRLPARGNGREPATESHALAAALEAQSEAGSVIRTHSPYATALAYRGRLGIEGPDTPLEGLGGIAVVPYYRPGTAGLAAAVADALLGSRVALIEAQGPVIRGTDIDDAVDRAEALEAAAKVLFILDGGGS